MNKKLSNRLVNSLEGIEELLHNLVLTVGTEAFLRLHEKSPECTGKIIDLLNGKEIQSSK